jgi:hypothetical protein
MAITRHHGRIDPTDNNAMHHSSSTFPAALAVASSDMMCEGRRDASAGGVLPWRRLPVEKIPPGMMVSCG